MLLWWWKFLTLRNQAIRIQICETRRYQLSLLKLAEKIFFKDCSPQLLTFRGLSLLFIGRDQNETNVHFQTSASNPDFNMSEVNKRDRDFSNPMYEAMGNMESAAEVEASKGVTPINLTLDSSEAPPPASAVLAPSSVLHKTSPPQMRPHKEVAPSVIDTGKDTQCLVVDGDEEDFSEC